MSTIDSLILVLYMVIVITIGLRKAGKVENSDDYLVAGRSLGFLVLTGTLIMTEFNTTTMISYSAFGYTAGLYATMLPIGLMIGMWVYAFLFSKRWKRINATSIADFFELRYGKRFRHVAALLFVISLILISATYLKAAAKVFSVALGLTEFWTAVILYLVVFIFTIWGGLVSVAWTDLASGMVAAVGIPVLLVFAYFNGGGFSGLSEVFDPKYLSWQTTSMMSDPFLPFSLILGIILGNVLNGQGYPWTAQRMFAAKDEQTAFRAMLCAAAFVSVLYMMPIATSAFARVKFGGLEDPELAFAYALVEWLPTGLAGLLLAVTFAIAQTTVSSIWNTTASMLSHDIYRGILKPEASSQDVLQISRWSTFFIAAFSFLVSLWVTQVLSGLYLAVIFRLCLNFAIWAGFLWYRANRVSAWVSTVIGLTLGLYFKATIPGNGWITYMNLAGNGLLILGGIAACLSFRPSEDEECERIKFYNKVGPPLWGKTQYLRRRDSLSAGA
ncbi:sodium:solute symporter family protein [Acidobacteria bacterium AH-259-O06]|nr:sodium:solute symporter family protein [Acidobacteria bacterium AH-259-O06]